MIWLESLSFRHGAHLKLIAPYVLPDYHSNSAGEMDDGSIFASWRQTIRQQFRVVHFFLFFFRNDRLSKQILNTHFYNTKSIASPKGQLISKCLFEKIVWTKIPTKNLIDSAQQV